MAASVPVTAPAEPTEHRVTRTRIDTVDYLRGLFALSILLYHYYTWGEFGGGDAVHDVMGKFGIYGVSAFYVISGISFGYVYRELRAERGALTAFYTKRLFRIAPLYWIAMAGVLAVPVLNRLIGEPAAFPSLGAVALNLTLAFAYVDPAGSLLTGGWSIGNELCFYLAFPFVIVGRRGGGWTFAAILGSSVAVGLWFAVAVLSPDRPLSEQWEAYVHPLNQVYLFVVGVGVSGWIGRAVLPARTSWTALVVLGALFLLLPGGEGSVLVTGWRRVAFSVVCVGICAVGAVGTLPLPRPVHRALSRLGEMSYSVYLLHPIVWTFTLLALWRVGVRSLALTAALALPATLLGAWLVYRWLETPMIRVGKDVAARFERGARGARAHEHDAPRSDRRYAGHQSTQ